MRGKARFLLFLCLSAIIYVSSGIEVTEISLSLSGIIHDICMEGEVVKGYQSLKELSLTFNRTDITDSDYLSTQARTYHTLSELALIIDSDVMKALQYHRLGKQIMTLDKQQPPRQVVPPLPELHFQGNKCGGTSDLYYISAVMIKKFIDSNQDIVEEKAWIDWIESLMTLTTLTSDSGFPIEVVENHWLQAMKLTEQLGGEERKAYHDSLIFRAALLTPGTFSSSRELARCRLKLESRIRELYERVSAGEISLSKLDEFVWSPTFYLIYFGQNDKHLLQLLHSSYQMAHPPLLQEQSLSFSPRAAPLNPTEAVVRVGFVSNYFRKHSICKLFCAIPVSLAAIDMTGNAAYEVFLFSTMQEDHHDDYTNRLVQISRTSRKHRLHFLSVGKPLLQTRVEITRRNIDILIYLDVGMDPATTIWATARLAPVQMVLWGHPSTTGLDSMDYFLSSDSYHRSPLQGSEIPQDFFSEQLIRLDSLTFQFIRPPNIGFNATSWGDLPVLRSKDYFQRIIQRIKQEKRSQSSQKRPSQGKERLIDLLRLKIRSLAAGDSDQVILLLCPQYLPKFHPDFDEILLALIEKYRGRVRILLLNDADKRRLWQNTLRERWITSLSLRSEVRHQGMTVDEARRLVDEVIVWLPSLSPEEYLWLVSIGDLMLDPFPFGGGVTTLEALLFCTPVITLPSRQNVPQLTAGMLLSISARIENEDDRRYFLDSLIVRDSETYLSNIDSLFYSSSSDSQKSGSASRLREAICKHSAHLYRDWQEVGDSSTSPSPDAAVQEWSSLLQRLSQSL